MTEFSPYRLVVVESPYAGDTELHVEYARAAMADSIARGEAPLASHLLYTQAGILDDSIPSQRARGIRAGLDWAKEAEATIVYEDLGISPGMALGIADARRNGRDIVFRKVDFTNLRLPHFPRLCKVLAALEDDGA